jgi:tight adherence protein B
VSALLGLVLGAGLILGISPVLWPRGAAFGGTVGRFSGRARERLTQAGLERVSPGTVAAVASVLGIAVGAAVAALLGVVALGVAAGLVAAAVPVALIVWRARTRRRANRVVWPDIVDHLVSAVRSGLALPDAVAALSQAGPEITRTEFAVFETTYRATGKFSLALDALKQRLADPVADRVVEIIRMAREVGGSELTGVLRNLSAQLRQEAAIRAEVEARQSWVLNAARLGAAAPWVVLLLLATRPEAAAAYNSPAGTVLIVGGLAIVVIAYRLMVALGRLPEDRRWFR